MKLKAQILLCLAETIDYLKGIGEAVFTPYPHIYDYFSDRNRGSIRRSVEDLLKTGNIEKIVEDGVPKFKITSQGKIKLLSEIPLAKFRKEPWDGIWRMVIFDIPEKEKKLRDALRQKLKELGFGKWQESVYISPFKISEQVSEFIKSRDLDDYAVVLESRKILAGDEKELARAIFNLDDLHAQYLDFLELCGAINNELNKKGRERKKILDLWQKIREAYYQILLVDPGLPKELLPEDWLEEEAEKLFKRVSKAVNQK